VKGVARLIIGDDLLTKIMLTNTLAKSGKLRSPMLQTSEFNTLFMNVLNQLLEQESLSIPPAAATEFFLANLDIGNVIETGTHLETRVNGKRAEPLMSGTITAEKLDQVLEGKLSGKGAAFIAAGQRYQVDPALLAAIAQHETGNGKSKAAIEKNNIAGMMGRNGLKSYASVEDSIMDMARNLSENYLAKGLTTIAKIGAKYAPVGAANDPTGLNNYWVSGVTKYYNKLNLG
jgi:hypothetical protein